MPGPLKKVSLLQQIVQRAPPFYPAARALLSQFDAASHSQQTVLADRLGANLVNAARRAPAFASLTALDDAPFLTKAELRAAPKRWRAPTLLPTSLAKTSGTSGAALEVARSTSQVMFEQAVIDWTAAKAGFDLARAKIAVLRADTIKLPGDRSPPYWDISADRRIVSLSAHHLDQTTFPAYADLIEAFAPDVLYAYPSSAAYLADLSVRAKRPLHFGLVLTSSEELPVAARAKLARVFSAKTADYYGQAERVAFAWSIEPGAYYFQPAYGRTELIKGDDGAIEIVGSAYHNRAQFLLRYRTGDHIITQPGADLAAVACGAAPFERVSGRASDIVYGPAGEVFIGLNHIPRPFDQIEALQIVQTGPGAVSILVHSQQDRSDALRDAIIAVARQKIGPVVALDVDFVEALRKTAAGKTPYVIHDWKPAP